MIAVIVSCSSTQESVKFEKHPTIKRIPSHTSSRHLDVKIPIGWREIKDNREQLFDIWLVNDENNATISFIPINLADNLLQNTEEEKLAIIEKIVINKKKSIIDDFEIVEQKEMNFNQISKSIKFLMNGDIQNSIIYGNGKNYYECLAYFSEKHSPEEEEIEYLIEIQKQIVSKSIIK